MRILAQGRRERATLRTSTDLAPERLSSRFFRSSLAQAQAIPGSGLGLSIAHAIVEKHGGTMSVESEPGEGTTFRVHRPGLTAP